MAHSRVTLGGGVEVESQGGPKSTERPNRALIGGAKDRGWL
jgi:hypothetical protein